MEVNDGFRIPKNLRDAPEMGHIPGELLMPIPARNGASVFFANTATSDFRQHLVQHTGQTINNLEKVISDNPRPDIELIHKQIIAFNVIIPLDVLQDPIIQNTLFRLSVLLHDSDFPPKYIG